MTAQEWLAHRHEDPTKLEELAIYHKFLCKDLILTESEKQTMEQYIRQGKKRQQEVMDLVAQHCDCHEDIIEDEVLAVVDFLREQKNAGVFTLEKSETEVEPEVETKQENEDFYGGLFNF